MNKLRVFSIILIVALLATGIFAVKYNKNESDSYAMEVFADTETLVKEKVSASKSFTILEVVGNTSDARLGYLVAGEEPVDLTTDTAVRDALIAENMVTTDSVNSESYPIYYDSGANTITNNNFLKKYIFGGIEDADSLNITVITKTPDLVSKSDVDGVDLIYISGVNSSDYDSQDFLTDVASALLRRITAVDAENPVPCIVDYSVYLRAKELHDNNTLPNSNLYKVTSFLLGDNIEKAYTDIILDYSSDISSDPWQQVLNTMVIDNAGHFVRSNVYWYAFDTEDFTSYVSTSASFASANIGSYLTTDAISQGFGAISDAIDAENYNNEASGSGRAAIPTNAVSPALVVQYILNYEKESGIIYKDSLNVLEIEPCKAYNFDTSEKKSAFINNYLPDFADNESAVTITCMTLAEFVGHNEDITEEYDLIYIGSNVDYYYTLTRYFYLTDAHTAPNYEARTFKRYTDTSMTGLVYTHVGDLANLPYWGLIYTDTSYTDKVQYREPGTDLTTYKYEELKNFLDDGYPIIVADDFFTYGNTYSIKATTGAPTDWNAGHELLSTVGDKIYGILDTSSYMYKLMVYAVTGQDEIIDPSKMTGDWAPGNWYFNNRAYKNLFNESGATAQGLLPYVNEQKLYLNLTSKPVEYSYTTTGSHNHINTSTYLAPAADGLYYLNYEFSISSLGKSGNGTTYNCELFIDINNDGKYSKTQEKIDALTVTNLYTGETVSPSNGVYSLVSGVAYRLTRALPSDYLGCISWELEVTSNVNSDIHDSKTGYTVVREDNAEKEHLNILQVTSGYSTAAQADYDGKKINANVLNLQNELANPSSMWGELLNNIPDFEISITTIPTYGDDGLVARFKADNNYLNNYDMVIFGFSDGFADIRYTDLLLAIEKYANSGHCVLFAHDNTFVQTSQLRDYYSYANEAPDGKKLYATDSTGLFSDYGGGWGDSETDARPRYLTQYVRRIAGMDQYGITTNGSVVRSGTAIKKYVDGTTTLTDAWKYLISQGKDIAYAPNTYQTETVANTQGATYIQCREYLVSGFANDWDQTRTVDNTFYAFDLGKGNIFRGLHTQDGADNYLAHGSDIDCNTLVEKVNDGMITNYPYKIPDLFYGANTHSQYWALDLETDADNDGESDLVVWYTVADYTTSDNDYYTDDLSSLSPKDARNNYYIYNMGNITYTGVGHTGGITEQEAKLFVNTMVASYVASVKNPKIDIVEDGTSQASDIDSVVIPYFPESAADSSALLGEYQRIYFSVADNNIAKGYKTIETKFYLDGNAIDLTVYDLNGNTVYSAGGSGLAGLSSGNTYYVDIPITKLLTANTNEFRIDIYTDWVRSGTRTTSDVVSDTVLISKVELYDLD